MMTLTFSTLLILFILLIIDRVNSNTYPSHEYGVGIVNKTTHDFIILQREKPDGPTVLMYIVIAAALIVPNIPQID